MNADDRVFIDTNVFVYAQDADEPQKQQTAQRLIRELSTQRRGVISTQIMMEYTAAARKRLKLTLAECRQAVLLMTRFDVVTIEPENVLGALDLATMYNLSHWDALVLKTASVAGCRSVVTEDLQDGQLIDGVRVANPFA